MISFYTILSRTAAATRTAAAAATATTRTAKDCRGSNVNRNDTNSDTYQQQQREYREGGRKSVTECRLEFSSSINQQQQKEQKPFHHNRNDQSDDHDACFICGVNLSTLKHRIDLMKRCSKRHAIFGKDVRSGGDVEDHQSSLSHPTPPKSNKEEMTTTTTDIE
jgi:hypothetical protein